MKLMLAMKSFNPDKTWSKVQSDRTVNRPRSSRKEIKP